MIILGVNGWATRSHDASAAIIVDGSICAFVEEERLTRYKHAFGQLPHRAIQECLELAGISSADIDMVAVGWDYHQKYTQRDIPIPSEAEDLLEVYLPSDVFPRKDTLALTTMEHHRAHAASVVRASPIGARTAAVLVVDGQGEDSSTSLWKYSNGILTKVSEWPLANSLGYYFEAHNRLLGFDFLDSGKTMGLASYGKTMLNSCPFELTSEGFTAPFTLTKSTDTTDEQERVIEAWFPILKRAYGLDDSLGMFDRWATKNSSFSQHEKNIAYTAQQHVTSVMIHLAMLAKRLTGAEVLCVAGGVGLNCPSNTALALQGAFSEVFVTPFASDQGVSLGAALEAASVQDAPFTPYTGRATNDSEILSLIQRYALHGTKHTNIEEFTARHLFEGSVIGWFQGRAEQGPRALGNRSILANPMIEGINDHVNNLKGRELWRPLAPSILAEDSSVVFNEPLFSPFMLHAFHVRKEFRDIFPAIVHVDGTARPQTVSAGQNRKYHALLRAFKRHSGYGTLLNTSFNGPGEPIVYTPEEAIRMFLRTGLDALVLEDWYITR